MRVAFALVITGVLVGALFAQEEPKKPAPKRAFVAIYGQGPKWVAGTRVDRQPGINDHGEYMLKMFRAGNLREGGPFLDNTGGMSVFLAKDEAEAKKFIADDPAIKSGIMKLVRLSPWYPVDWARAAKR